MGAVLLLVGRLTPYAWILALQRFLGSDLYTVIGYDIVGGTPFISLLVDILRILSGCTSGSGAVPRTMSEA